MLCGSAMCGPRLPADLERDKFVMGQVCSWLAYGSSGPVTCSCKSSESGDVRIMLEHDVFQGYSDAWQNNICKYSTLH